jgi:beta-ureidopropionase / N-carbamoyl-L-amino-acid hydrolase
MRIESERLIKSLRELATFGSYQTGVNRPAYSSDDLRARKWLNEKFKEAGLASIMDDAGNVYGQMTSANQAVLIGSHTDTVPRGGWLDGSLGVIYGLEIARCFAQHGLVNGSGVDIISFEDEEGTFLALYGSRVFCGEDLRTEVAQARNQDGKTLEAAIREASLDTQPKARLDPGRHIAYFEAHIEQGPRLEAEGKKIGIVSAIVGIRTYRIVFKGRADHAGTTPMAMRQDAGAAALRFGTGISAKLRAVGSPETVWNIGSVSFRPGASNVVPDEAQLVLQFRDASSDILQSLEEVTYETVRETAELHGVRSSAIRTLETKPTNMDSRLQACIEQATRESGHSGIVMVSGAGHDAMTVAKYLPSAMLFVPSIGGRSHHISEDTAEADIVIGAQVMLDAIEHRLRKRTL